MFRCGSIQVYPRNRVKQDMFPSVSAAFEHFRQTGESVFESKPSNSYDFGTDVDVSKADLDSVVKDTTLVDAYLLAHGEKSRQEISPSEAASVSSPSVVPDAAPDAVPDAVPANT